MRAHRFAVAVAILAVAPVTARADDLAGALARGDAATIRALRPRLDEPAVRCTIGGIYARLGDRARAGLYLGGCADAPLPDDLAAVREIARATLRALDASDLARIEVSSNPPGLRATASVFPDDPFVTPAVLWVKPGSFLITADAPGVRITNEVHAVARARSLVFLIAPPPKPPAPPQDASVNFDDQALDDQQTAPPPDVKHPNVMAPKYRGAAAVREAGEAGEPTLVDPLAERPRPPPGSPTDSIGFRLGGGLFDGGAAETTARAGVALAVTGRHFISSRSFLLVRLDWSRRGGAAEAGPMQGTSVDVIGAAIGPGIRLVAHHGLDISLLGQMRLDLRLTDSHGSAAVRRIGAGAALGLEVALPATQLTAGVRFEQGMFELASGRTDRAALLEVGLDLR